MYRKRQRTAGNRARAPRANFVSGGVGGAAATMPAGPQLPQEVKFKDFPIVNPFTTAASLGTWKNIVPNNICTIVQGAGPSQRIGRNIRVVGIVYRIMVQNVIVPAYAANERLAVPFTLDFLWDKKCNGALALPTEIYSGAGGLALPNPLYDTRFKWSRRVENKDPNTRVNLISGSLKCNEVINYRANTGAITDIEGVNLMLYMAIGAEVPTTQQGLGLGGLVRVLYVDA